MKRVITYGTFDLLHYGHINLLRRAKALGDYLIVGLSTDQFNWQEKQKKSYFTYEERKAMLEAIRYVDLVIPEENWDQKKPTWKNTMQISLSSATTGKGRSTSSGISAKLSTSPVPRRSPLPKSKQSFTPDWQLPENGPRQLFQALNRPIHPASPLPIVHIASHMHKRNIIN